MPPDPFTSSDSTGWLLRPRDQRVVASLLVLSAMVLAGWYLAQGGLSGGLIDIDDAAPLASQFRVDLNRADWPELAQLPEVGETLAKAIVADRQRAGPFRRAEDLLRVEGIGPATLEHLRPFLGPLEAAPSADDEDPEDPVGQAPACLP